MIEQHATVEGRQIEILRDGEVRQPGVTAGFGLHFWRGASGHRYLHAAYALLACPDLPASNFVLVRRETDQSMAVVMVGSVSRASMSANLATIRQTAAQLGANEVHILTSETTDPKRQLIADDIAKGNGLVALPAAVAQVDIALSVASAPSLMLH